MGGCVAAASAAAVVALVLLCSLCPDPVACSSSSVLLSVTEAPCEIALSVEITGGRHLDNGSLLAGDGIVYPPGLYWEDESAKNGSRVLRGCVCRLKTCIRKCCQKDERKNMIGTGCVASDHALLDPFQPNISDLTGGEKYPSFYNLYGDSCKLGKYMLDPSTDRFSVDKSGNLHLHEASGNITLSPEFYCLELVIESDRIDILAFPCFPEDIDEPPITAAGILYPLGMLVSEPFLIATFVVYAIIPELRNLHGKSLMSHVLSLIVAYLFLSIVQLGSNSISDEFCTVSAFIIQFSFLASFFWLNIMCFDLWWTFSGCRPMRGSVRERDHKKFIIYSMYSWGCPLIILTVTMIMDLSPNISDVYAKPKFGDGRCWFEKENYRAMWAYFYGPVAIILTANMLMFITTAVKIVKLKKETAMLQTSTESKRHDDEENSQRFSLYLKLFVVMGVNWVMEVISWAVGGPEYIWFVTDMGNTLQGVLIFIIFVWKDKVRKLLRKRFSDSADSKSQQYSTASKSTRVFSSTRSSLRNTSANASQNDFNMSPVARNT